MSHFEKTWEYKADPNASMIFPQDRTKITVVLSLQNSWEVTKDIRQILTYLPRFPLEPELRLVEEIGKYVRNQVREQLILQIAVRSAYTSTLRDAIFNASDRISSKPPISGGS